jgi:NADH:ubiquinone oxidoreductase subunit 6 (subunit J)
METIIISLFLLLSVAAAVYASLVRHTLYCIIGLGLTLFGIAGVFLYLGSPFVAAMQILIYIGGISVAMVFALMLSVSLSRPVIHSWKKVAATVAVGVSFFAVMAAMILTTDFHLRETPAPDADWALPRVGHEFLTTYNLAFEGLSLALLMAIVAAILVAHRVDKPS